ncbi:MAG: hypothetical protein KGQ59_08465 [Bdellovibrionales bacterium]|nr:hypothetical protein [Bdellovibrionales bacterium]
MKLFKNSKRTQKYSAVVAASLAFLAVGCGKQRAGQYHGVEVGQNPITNTSAPTQVVLSIQESQSDFVSGTWETESSSGTFTGTLKSDQIENVWLTKGTKTSSNGSTSALTNSAYYLTQEVPCLGKYNGSLKFDGKTISGTLRNTAAQQGTNGTTSMLITMTPGACVEISVNASKID